MRFHFGVSLSWRTIKKFLFPFLLGILAYFGFNFIYDNKPIIDLGFIKANALENYDTSYNIDYYNVYDLYNSSYVDGSNTTFGEFFNSIQNIENKQYNFLILLDGSPINNIYVCFFNNNITSIPVNIYSRYSSLYFQFNGANIYSGMITFNTNVENIYNTTEYTNLLNYFNGSYSNNLPLSNYPFLYYYTSFSNTLSYDLQKYINNTNLYYSSIPINIVNTYKATSDNYFYKKVSINNTSYNVGDNFPTIYDLFKDVPTDDNVPIPTIHKPLFNKIYWFDDKNTDTGILSSIYILLFLYCLTIIILKIIAIIHNVRWKR